MEYNISPFDLLLKRQDTFQHIYKGTDLVTAGLDGNVVYPHTHYAWIKYCDDACYGNRAPRRNPSDCGEARYVKLEINCVQGPLLLRWINVNPSMDN